MLDIGKRLRIVLGALALAFAALAATLQAAPEVYVASAGDHSTGAGWSTAFTNVQATIDAVDDGGSIHLKGETFTITNQLTWIGGADVTLRGGYQGVGVPGPRDPRQWPTTLQRNGSVSGGCEFGAWRWRLQSWSVDCVDDEGRALHWPLNSVPCASSVSRCWGGSARDVAHGGCRPSTAGFFLFSVGASFMLALSYVVCYTYAHGTQTRSANIRTSGLSGGSRRLLAAGQGVAFRGSEAMHTPGLQGVRAGARTSGSHLYLP